LSNGDRSYQKTNGSDARDAAQLFDGVDSGNWGNASHGANGTHSPMTWGYKFTSGSKQCSQMILVQPPNTHHAGNVTIKYWDGTSMTDVSNQSPLSMDNQTTDNDPTTFTFDAVSSQFWQIDCYRGSSNSTNYTGLHAWEIYDNLYEYVTGTTPSQVYDNTKTITVSNVPSGTSTVGKIYKGSTAYTIHATTSSSNVIIKNTGSYVSVFTTATQAFLTNAVNVNATPTTTSDDTTIEDAEPIVTTTTSTSIDTTLAFHYGSFDTVYGDADVEEAANNGRIFDDTPSSGTSYTWGTLDSTPSTASNQTTYTWTPTSDITGADVLMVAGGGGGGKQVGGGGGAGGLLHHTNQTLSGQKTIVVGDGGIGGDYTLNVGASNGNNTTFTGFDNDAIGGGRGASYDGFSSGTGGSGGGGGGNSTTGQTGTSGQGNNGGSGRNSSWAGGGGGGAGAAGQGSPSNNVGGYGGAGLNKSSVFGTTYGDSGWFAGGGGGCGSGTNTVGAGGQGGGGQGGNTATVESGVRKAGTKHTGGGGGGTRDGNNFSGSSVSYALSQDGGKGGSGIVLVKFTAQVTTTTTTGGIAGSTAVPVETTTDTPSAVLDATDTTVTDPILDLDFTTTLPRNLKRYNTITSSSIGARFNRTESKKKRVHKSINTDKFSIELTANNMGDSSSSTSTLPVTVVNSGAGTQYTSGWTTAGSTSSFVVPSDAPNALYYYSQNDDSAGGSISVSSASTTTHTVTVVSSSAGTQYTSGWATTPAEPNYNPGNSNAVSTFAAPNNAPNTLYYYCGAHSGMGGAINMVDGPVSTTFTVTVSSYYGSNYYYIDGTRQATISLVRGKTYTFNNNASGSHPMYITTSSDGATYNYPSGGWNDGSSTVTFVVPMDAPSTLYYKCNNHGGMGGTIHILGPTASPLAVTVSGGKFVIGDVSQATLQLVRGETYVFNQEDNSNGTHPIRLSETSDGTHVSSGSGFYIGGTQRPTLTMVRGNTYTFDQTNASNGSHVLQIATASDGTQYTSGYTTGTFVVPLSAPDTLYYKSSTTSGMGGLINVTGSTTSAFVVTFSGGKFSIGGVEQASLSVIRGLTYTFNQISGHVLSLSSTSDGTRNTGVNKYYISGVETPTLTFIRGNTYTFDQSDDTNDTHPIRLSETSNGTHASGSPSQYTSGWTTTTPASPNYVPGVPGATSQFVVDADTPSTLYYYCGAHSGMGGTGSINVADSNSGIILTYGTHALVANSTVSGEYTIATNFDGTTSNLYVDGALISQTTPTIASGAKTIKIGEDYNGLIKNLKFWNYAKSFLQQALVEGTFEKHGINGNSTSYFLLGARAVEATPWYSGYSMPRSTSKADAFAITSGGTSGGTNTSQGTYPTTDPGPSIGSGHVVANSFHFATDMTKVDKIYFLSANGTYGLEFSLQDYADVPAPATGGGDAGGTITITDKFGYTATSIYVLKRVSNPEDPWINTGTTHNYTQMFYGDSTGNADGSHMSDNGGFYIYASLI
jgi:plastocyanin